MFRGDSRCCKLAGKLYDPRNVKSSDDFEEISTNHKIILPDNWYFCAATFIYIVSRAFSLYIRHPMLFIPVNCACLNLRMIYLFKLEFVKLNLKFQFWKSWEKRSKTWKYAPWTSVINCIHITEGSERWNLLRLGEPRLLEWTKRSQYTTSYPYTAQIIIWKTTIYFLFIKTDSKEIIQKKDFSAREIWQLIKLEMLHNIKKLSALLPSVCTWKNMWRTLQTISTKHVAITKSYFKWMVISWL